MKKTLYIHIGRPKTGSSAIQHFLADNRKVLARHGCLYPQTGQHHKASHKFALVFLPSLPDAKLVKGQSPKELYGALADEVSRSGLKKAVISSEMFYLTEPDDIMRSLRDQFHVKIICYVRRQDEVLLSSYVQEIKGNEMSVLVNFDEYLRNPTRMALLDYKSNLDKWAAVFGHDAIIVRVYHKAGIRDTIFEDFFRTLGMRLTDEYQLPTMRLNPSPARDILEMITHVNRFRVSDAVLRQLRAPLVRISETIGNGDKFDTNLLLNQNERRKIMQMFAKSNRQVAQTYLGREDGILFETDFPEDAAGADEYQGIELYRFVQIVAGLFVNQQKEISDLRARLIHQADRIAALERQLDSRDTSGMRESWQSGWLNRLKIKLVG